MIIVNTKSLARIAAVQSLYHCTVIGSWQDLSFINNWLIEYYEDGARVAEDCELAEPAKIKLNTKYYLQLLDNTIDNLGYIDQLISNNLASSKELSDLSSVLLSILRVAIAELIFTTTPAKIVVNEFTTLASCMAFNSEIAFVNSILDNISQNQKSIYGSQN